MKISNIFENIFHAQEDEHPIKIKYKEMDKDEE